MRTFLGSSMTMTMAMASLLATACGGGTGGAGGSGATGGGGSGGTGGAPAVELALSPASATVLTCTTATFTATVTGSSDAAVAWSASPGSIDEKGLYSAPKQVPAPASATVTATAHADAEATKSADVTLATAVPGKAVTITDKPLPYVGVYQHHLAGHGDRVYAAYPTADKEVVVRRSDDGGKTWSAAVNVAPDADIAADCVTVAVDPVDPDAVYVVYRLSQTYLYGSFVPSNAGSSNEANVFASSTDGGKTWTRSPLMLGGVSGGPYDGHNTAGICPDVVAPAADAVIVEFPGAYAGDGNPDMYLFADAHRGAGFATGTTDGWDYQADGETEALATPARGLLLDVGQNGGSGPIGESPRLFTDGKGKTCLTWTGYGSTESKDGVYVQCSTDLGKTFSAPLALTKAALSSPHLPAGALGPGGELAVVWTADSDPTGTLLFSTSPDGKAWSAPAAVPLYVATDLNVTGAAADVAFDAAGILWVAYQGYDGGLADRIIVDKSCDGGATWSGAVLVNGPEGGITNATFPGLVATKSGLSVSSYTGYGSVEGSVEQLQSLMP
jgi:hypothetical protein